eukprot:jgi/Orpsp1_1/1190819/evm.model.d7180000081403.1
MDRIILNKKNYKIWSALVMGELEEANLEHTVPSDSTTTENTTEGERTTINEISAKAKRIIYKHLSESTWEKVEDIDTAYELWNYLKIYYYETDEEKMKKYKRNLEELKYNGEELKIFIADFENLWNNYSKSVTKLDPFSSKNNKSEKLYYFRNTFKENYPDIYERLTYPVVKEEDITVMKQIIELTLRDKETKNRVTINENKSKTKPTNLLYDAQPVYKKKCFLCGSFDHLVSQCSMKDSFNNWKKIELTKLKEKEKGFNIKENYNVETERTTQTIVNNPDILKEKKLKDCIINFLNNNTNKSNVSGKLSIKIGSAVGSLIHLARCTRPDISETISKLSTKRNNPTVKDWKMVQNVLKYLNKTRNYFLKFNDKEDITTYSDASFGPKDTDDNAKSTTGYIIYIGCAPI